MKKNNLTLEGRVRKRNVQGLILKVLYTSGLVSVALLAPNVILAMNKAGLLPGRRQKESINTSRNRLIKKGFVEFHEGRLRITQKGKDFLAKEDMYMKFQNEHKKWDGKWRILVFDIPEKRRLVRNRIRRALVSIGFMRLQDSVWIYPYNCEDLVTLLKADFKIGKDVLYMVVEELEYDGSVRSYFGLS